MEIIFLSYRILFYAQMLVAYGLAVLAVYGGISLLMTREDAFFFLNRDKKLWVGLCFGAALLLAFGGVMRMITLIIIGAVIVGIYWQDIRPALKELLD